MCCMVEGTVGGAGRNKGCGGERGTVHGIREAQALSLGGEVRKSEGE